MVGVSSTTRVTLQWQANAMTPPYRWPEDWDQRRTGADCPMCASNDADHSETPHGVVIFNGRWSRGYLGRHPVRHGYGFLVWKGRHVAEPSELSPEESAGFWSEVATVARVLEDRYQPAKMNWFSLGNGVPHLHVHLVPRPVDDPYAGLPLEEGAFYFEQIPAIDPIRLNEEAQSLREALEASTG
jgi:diadenosine tetraphosphate (Ap4A) HIT family hydrolase